MRRLRYLSFLFAAVSLWPISGFAQNSLSDIPRGAYNPVYADEVPTGSITRGLGPPAYVAPQPPVEIVGFDKYTNKVFVNGFVFDADDDQAAVESRKALDGPIVQLPPNYRPMSPEEYKGYVSRSAYRIKSPVKAFVRSAMNRIKNHFRENQREYKRRKSKIMRDIRQCVAIAESMYPGDDDAASDYADDCVDNLPSARPSG
jgi:hypothetical protein